MAGLRDRLPGHMAVEHNTVGKTEIDGESPDPLFIAGLSGLAPGLPGVHHPLDALHSVLLQATDFAESNAGEYRGPG